MKLPGCGVWGVGYGVWVWGMGCVVCGVGCGCGEWGVGRVRYGLGVNSGVWVSDRGCGSIGALKTLYFVPIVPVRSPEVRGIVAREPYASPARSIA
eukprot:COSAG02_NODE_1333_length_13206_cov_221.257801_17_plen_96_part_00